MARADDMSPREMPTVSVVVPARAAAGTLPATLSALSRQQLDEAYEVIVVDNGGNGDALAEAQSVLPQLEDVAPHE
jgi:glycosyltransferase involved in cell wall biosynthesis